MVAEGRVKPHSAIEQGFVRDLEFLREISGLMRTINVVSEHNHEIKTHRMAIDFHLLRDLILLLIAGAAVADYPETHRIFSEGQFYIEPRRGFRVRPLQHPSAQQLDDRFWLPRHPSSSPGLG